MSYSLQIEVPGIPEITPNARMHWRAAHSHNVKWKQWVRICVGANKPKEPLPKARLVLTRYSGVQPDPDNLAASFKPVIDGLRECGVLLNDRHQNIDVKFDWKKAPAKCGKISIFVEAL